MLVFKIPGRKCWDELVEFPRTKLFNFSLRREEQIQIFSVYLGFYQGSVKSLGSHGRNLSCEEKMVV